MDWCGGLGNRWRDWLFGRWQPRRIDCSSSRESSAQAQEAIIRTSGGDRCYYLAAWLVVVEYAQLASGETLLVIGVVGGVGGAAAQIGKWRGAHVIGLDQHQLQSDSPAARAVDDFFVLEGGTLDSI